MLPSHLIRASYNDLLLSLQPRRCWTHTHHTPTHSPHLRLQKVFSWYSDLQHSGHQPRFSTDHSTFTTAAGEVHSRICPANYRCWILYHARLKASHYFNIVSQWRFATNFCRSISTPWHYSNLPSNQTNHFNARINSYSSKLPPTLILLFSSLSLVSFVWTKCN